MPWRRWAWSCWPAFSACGGVGWHAGPLRVRRGQKACPAAEAGADFPAFTARLKPSPDTNLLYESLRAGLCARVLNVVPSPAWLTKGQGSPTMRSGGFESCSDFVTKITFLQRSANLVPHSFSTEGDEWIRRAVRAAAVPGMSPSRWTSVAGPKAWRLSGSSVPRALAAAGSTPCHLLPRADRTAFGACENARARELSSFPPP